MSNRSERRKLERSLKSPKKKNRINPNDTLYNLKYKCSYLDIENIYQQLPESHKEFVKGDPLPKTYIDLRKKGMPTKRDKSFAAEINWFTWVFMQYDTEINHFNNLKNIYELHFLQGNYNKALEILEQIENEICVSQWSIENKLLLAEYSDGFKANKKLLSEIKGLKLDVVVQILAQHYSTRAERNLSLFKYDQIIDDYLAQYNEPLLKDYFLFKFNFIKSKGFSNKEFLLFYETNTSIIDRYLLYMQICAIEISENFNNPSATETIKLALNRLREKIVDPQISNLLSYIELSAQPKVNKDDLLINSVYFDFLRGHYKKAYEETKKILLKYPACIELYDVHIKCFVELFPNDSYVLESNTIHHRLLYYVFQIVKKTGETDRSIEEILKIITTFGFNHWTAYLNVLISREYPDTVASHELSKLSDIMNNYLNPRIVTYYSDQSISKNLLSRFISKGKQNSLIDFYNRLENLRFNNSSYLDFEIISYKFNDGLFKAKLLQDDSKYVESSKIIENLLRSDEFKQESSIDYKYLECCSLLLNSYLELGEIERAVNLIVESVLKHPFYINKLTRKDEIVSAIENSNDSSIWGNISVPILYSMIEMDNKQIHIAADNFLFEHNSTVPHELAEKDHSFDRKKLVYFLKNVCKQEILHSSHYFNSLEELNNERIEVCIILTKIDELNKDVYVDEISRISQTQMIKKAIKQFDESKIYVDVSGIKNKIDKNLRESFHRNIALSSFSGQDLIKILEQTLAGFKKSPSEKSEMTKRLPSQVSRMSLFMDMFQTIRDNFISSNEYGLDSYLSMRIRHGTLLGQIRSVFENAKLITKKNNLKYAENEYWNAVYVHLSNEDKLNLQTILSDFSSEVDKLSEELKDVYIQINTEKKQTNGLFNYSYSNRDLSAFYLKTVVFDDYDDFFDEVIEELWRRTEENLLNVRKIIKEEFEIKLVVKLNELQQKINVFLGQRLHQDTSEVSRNITTCRTNISYEMNKISQWFQRIKTRSIQDFIIELPIETGIHTIRKMYPSFENLKTSITNTCVKKLDGEYFSQFTDMIFILMENIIKHSGLNQEQLNVEISVSETNNELLLMMNNNLSPDEDLIELNKKIIDIRNKLYSSHDLDVVRKEGGSGYLKLNKILQVDLFRNAYKITIDEITETRIFKTTIKFSLNDLEKKKENELVTN